MTLSSGLLVFSASFALRRAARERRRALEKELAAYTSASDLADLSAMMERYPDGQTAEMRSILARQSCLDAGRPLFGGTARA